MSARAKTGQARGKWAGADLFRFLRIVLIGGLVAFAGLPDGTLGHTETAETIETLLAVHDESIAVDQQPDVVPTDEHCHPGLDCITAVALRRVAGLPARSGAGKEKIWFNKLENDRWTPLSDIPPPRHFS